ncbi:PREDICTED: uncharacterized protein LOC106896609 [Calidris pugnax]|uniref:uncharacterized protein LOC106896609 n=1 Tax=Calidris pugnax TaxID=198806 RepID=UPI00071E50D3|nr:PREDICTED: uncharacterized protein LOC106896609 [Calidris pugnax]
MIRCIGVIHDARKMIRSYRQAALILVPKDITTTHGMDKAQTIKSITLSPQPIPFPKVKCSNTILNYNAPIIYKKYVIHGENIACKKEIKTFTQPFTFRSMVTCNASEKAENITINIKYNSTEKGKFIIWEVPTGTLKATCQQPQCSFTIVNQGEAVYKIGALWSLESRSATFLFPFALHVPRRNIITPSPTTIPLFEPTNCAVKYHNLSFAGPYVVRQSNEQKLFLDPTYSLKKVRVKVQADISQIKSECLPFVSQSLKGWKAWLHSRAHHSRKQRDLTGWFGSGLGVLNSIDQEVIINKLSTVTSDLGRLEVPLRSSLITLAGAQQLTVDFISLLSNHTTEDFQAVATFVQGLQGNVSIAIKCIQTQQVLETNEYVKTPYKNMYVCMHTCCQTDSVWHAHLEERSPVRPALQ